MIFQPPKEETGKRDKKKKVSVFWGRGQFKYHVGVALSISERGVLFVGLSEPGYTDARAGVESSLTCELWGRLR